MIKIEVKATSIMLQASRKVHCFIISSETCPRSIDRKRFRDTIRPFSTIKNLVGLNKRRSVQFAYEVEIASFTGIFTRKTELRL